MAELVTGNTCTYNDNDKGNPCSEDSRTKEEGRTDIQADRLKHACGIFNNQFSGNCMRIFLNFEMIF